MSDHYHYDYASERHDHRGQYADARHDHGLDYAEKHHRHYDDESAVRGLREDLGRAEERIRELEDAARQWRQDAEERVRALDGGLRGALAFIRVLDRLRPTCVICRDAAADRQTVRGPACSDCVGDLPDDAGPDPDRPETWAFPEADGLRGQLGNALERIRVLEGQTPQARQLRYEADLAAAGLAESGYDRHGGGCQCPFCFYDPEEDKTEPEPAEHDPGPEADDEGGMSEYRYAITPEEPWS